MGDTRPARETASVTRIHAVREPFGRELARDLRAFQQNRRQDRARQSHAIHLVGQREKPAVQPRLLEFVRSAELEIAADLHRTHVQALRQRSQRCFRCTRLGRGLSPVVTQEVAIERERHA